MVGAAHHKIQVVVHCKVQNAFNVTYMPKTASISVMGGRGVI